MDTHEILEGEGGRYVIVRNEHGMIGVHYRRPDGTEIPSSPDFVDWMPELLRLVSDNSRLREELAKKGNVRRFREDDDIRAFTRRKLIEVLQKNFRAGKVSITTRRFNQILTDLGYRLEEK